MESPSPSKRIIKYTYLDRQKKKRGGQGHSELFSESDNEMPLETQSNASSRVNKGKKPVSSMKPPSSIATKKSEFKVPSPKQSRDDTFKPPSSSHARQSPVGSLNRVTNDEASPSTNRKPPSSVGRSAKPRSSIKQPVEREEEESDEDDNASVAESFISLSRVRRNEAERTEYFKNQPECQFIEDDSHHVKCTRCGKVVNLGTKRPFTVRPWEKHREKCDQQVPSSMLNEETGQPASPSARSKYRKPKTEEERKALLESDLRAQIVKENETLCKRCQKWIRCSSQTYSLFVWNKHQLICSDTSPSTRVATAADRIRLVNDPQVKDCGPRHVDCKFCESTIQLEGDYDPTNWITHQTTCTTPLPPPSATSESTLVAPSDGSSEMRGVKRPLEEAADDDTPRLNRPRRANYRPEDKEAPSALGWFLMPFKAFARGFKESIDNMRASGS
ncbi:uncharacterized protein EV420DRAFT_1506523 [Desarmillaria tabescens]|uniref:Uncharacterized protein n=1 Tax=Armillaria tabescens TaxID=1929756 RepID=A0AA39TUN3_ARMTA|nr:uncharacterized protein EV420DRAFT_1506523 [Desarmillaria tabescens]KAK0466978.1 hypothetical protein EV420DRAFT_1506523 [Desarmillaria tabescens]